jgi:diaminopimelate decarboxylase
LRFWRTLTNRALQAGAQTPCYLFSALPVQEALGELASLEPALAPLAVRHWLSCKTQPLPVLLQWWRQQGRPIEVVSELEFRLARTSGFSTSQILINGPAKQHWLPICAARGLRVNFDSPNELAALLTFAKRHRWCTGLRLLTDEEADPESPSLPTQFGFEPATVPAAVRRLRRAGLEPETAHFHLRTNVADAASFGRAIRQAAEICRAAGWRPRQLDIGGGLPPPNTLSHDGRRFDAHFRLPEFAAVLRRETRAFPGLREVWLENGRFVSARSGALLITVVDVKERRGLRQLICDGGRTLHALVSNWEQHELISLPRRPGSCALTAVYGPTCMAFDRLACRPLPRSLRPGDRLLWLDAGAYHLPWETHFSHDLAAVLWHDGRKTSVVRERGDFAKWRRQWR